MAGVSNTSTNQALTIRLLDDLGKLMWAMVWDVANQDRWVLAPEEVHAELCLEMVKTVQRYGDKPYIELKKLCVRCMRNRVYDLASSQYLTHRKVEAKIVSLDSGDTDQHDEETVSHETVKNDNPYSAVDTLFDMDDFLNGLSPDAQALVKEVMNPSKRTMYFLWLNEQRKLQTNPKGFWTVTITPPIMVRSMGWTKDRLNSAWKEVSNAVNGLNFDGGLVAKENGNGR